MASERSVTLTAIWASGAVTVIPPTPVQGIGYRNTALSTSDIEDGYSFDTIPSSADTNQAIFEIASIVSEVNTRGIAGWSDQVDYATVPAVVRGSDGEFYESLLASGPGVGAGVQDPISSPTYWQVFRALDLSTLTISNSDGDTDFFATVDESGNQQRVSKANIALSGFNNDLTFDEFPTGTRMLFQQTAAPTGWTKDVSAGVNNRALRITNGTAGTGGSVGFTTLFGRTATDGHTLLLAETPAHTHLTGGNTVWGSVTNEASLIGPDYDPPDTDGRILTEQSRGGDQAHSHNIDMRVLYTDVIIATKN